MLFKVAGAGSWCSGIWLCILFSLDLERILSFIVLSSSIQINFGLSLFFTAKVLDWLKNYFWFFFFLINSINISPCVEPMCRDEFFPFWKKISAPATSCECSPIPLIGTAIITWMRFFNPLGKTWPRRWPCPL